MSGSRTRGRRRRGAPARPLWAGTSNPDARDDSNQESLDILTAKIQARRCGLAAFRRTQGSMWLSSVLRSWSRCAGWRLQAVFERLRQVPPTTRSRSRTRARATGIGSVRSRRRHRPDPSTGTSEPSRRPQATPSRCMQAPSRLPRSGRGFPNRVVRRRRRSAADLRARLRDQRPGGSPQKHSLSRSVDRSRTGELADHHIVHRRHRLAQRLLRRGLRLTSGPNTGKATWTPLVVTAPPTASNKILVHATATNVAGIQQLGWQEPLRLQQHRRTPAAKVSFDRPFATDRQHGHVRLGGPVRPVARAREGYDVAYASDIDTHRNPALLQGYRLVIVNGHDEYWSTPIRTLREREGGRDEPRLLRREHRLLARPLRRRRPHDGRLQGALPPTRIQTRRGDRPVPRSRTARDRSARSSASSTWTATRPNRTYTVVNAALIRPVDGGNRVHGRKHDPGGRRVRSGTRSSTGCASRTQTVFFAYPGSPHEQLPAAHATTVRRAVRRDRRSARGRWTGHSSSIPGRPPTLASRCSRGTRSPALSGGSPPPPNHPPTVPVTRPANNATVFGSITVSASCQRRRWCRGVQFKLDGDNFGAEDTTSPYIAWLGHDELSSNGQHS